jgi:hypothetical protein
MTRVGPEPIISGLIYTLTTRLPLKLVKMMFLSKSKKKLIFHSVWQSKEIEIKKKQQKPTENW